MKRVLSIVLCVLMIACIFAACSGGSKAYTPGTAEGDVFTSEWIGIKYNKGEDYIFATKEELRELIDVAADAIKTDEKTGEEIIDYAKANSVIEMMASSIYGDNVLLMTEKLPMSNITMDQYVESLQNQVAATFTGRTTYEIAGKEFTELDFKLELSGITLYQNYYLYKIENRMVAIITTFFENETCYEMLKGFKAYNTK